ncbi:hypothetical protein NUU61_000692 [Penicillium alfredii]|uniref:Uncharacterized protein n=1 Tax=Penicillium alfredii TaxID=1506179 RepID=A0A9W9GAK5_9EURO|nr:uncharacterized protein NUU61_000692 [Penicillium alfredii]KAJ5114933.1 hypothetical protein NUU61_000692 [Penicillium alfredii]
MSEQSDSHHKGGLEGMMDRIFHRTGHPQKEEHHDEDKNDQEEHGHDSKKKGSEMDKFKDYIKEDEELEAEGKTYSNLM